MATPRAMTTSPMTYPTGRTSNMGRTVGRASCDCQARSKAPPRNEMPGKGRVTVLSIKQIAVDVLHDIVPTQAHQGQFLVGLRLEHFDLVAARRSVCMGLEAHGKCGANAFDPVAQTRGRCGNVGCEYGHLETSLGCFQVSSLFAKLGQHY